MNNKLSRIEDETKAGIESEISSLKGERSKIQGEAVSNSFRKKCSEYGAIFTLTLKIIWKKDTMLRKTLTFLFINKDLCTFPRVGFKFVYNDEEDHIDYCQGMMEYAVVDRSRTFFDETE